MILDGLPKARDEVQHVVKALRRVANIDRHECFTGAVEAGELGDIGIGSQRQAGVLIPEQRRHGSNML
jgi:hypothetical protein